MNVSFTGSAGDLDGILHVSVKSNGDVVLRHSTGKTRVGADEYVSMSVMPEAGQ